MKKLSKLLAVFGTLIVSLTSALSVNAYYVQDANGFYFISA